MNVKKKVYLCSCKDIGNDMASTMFNKYVWLVNTIYETGRISKEDIDRRWAACYLNDTHETHIQPRAFHRYKEAILLQLGLDIQCDRSTGRYYIANEDDLKAGTLHTWLCNTFAVSNLIQDSQDLHERIIYEHIPSGTEYLTTIIQAMRDQVELALEYQSYKRTEPETLEIQPYCVKVFKQRWYVVGKVHYTDGSHTAKEEQTPRVYALDRIRSASVLPDKTWKMPKDFHADEYFAGYYGVIRDERVRPMKIRIKATAGTANYLRSLPLHTSQKEVEQTGDYSIFEYFIAPTLDFVQELRSQGESIEVLTPADLRNKMQQSFEKGLKQYKK